MEIDCCSCLDVGLLQLIRIRNGLCIWSGFRILWIGHPDIYNVISSEVVGFICGCSGDCEGQGGMKSIKKLQVKSVL
jgi:hypothetical protein